MPPARALEVGRFLAAAISLPAVVFAVAMSVRPVLAFQPPSAPTVYAEDGPFTRNPVVRLAIDADYTDASPAVEWYAANDPATTNGHLVNGVLVPTGVGDWTLAAGPDGPRTIYGQTHHLDGSWSPVGSVAVTLDTSPESRLVIDTDNTGGFGNITGDPPIDLHQSMATPGTHIYGEAHTWSGGQSVSVGAGGWGVTFASNTGPIAPGTYAVPAPDQYGACGTSCAGLSHGSNPACLGAGTFTVTSISITGEDDLATLVADFRLACGSTIMAGSIRYGSTADVSFLDQDALGLSFRNTDIGATSITKSITFTNAGDVPNTLGAASISGGAEDDFTIVTDTCSGEILDVDESCSVSAEFSPTDRGHRFADLVLPDTTPKLGRTVRLGGDGWQSVTLDVDPVSVPAYGPGEATIVVTAYPGSDDITGPGLLIDGDGPGTAPLSTAVLTNPSRFVSTWVVTLGPGTHELTGTFGGFPHAYYRDAVPVTESVQVGTKTSVDLTTVTDDGVMLGESVDLVARFTSAGPVTGTLEIREDPNGPVIATKSVTGNADLAKALTPSLGTHPYSASFTPTSPNTQSAADSFDVAVAPGPRPETIMDPSPLHTWSWYALSVFGSPTTGATFECRYNLSNWYACTSPSELYMNSYGTETFTVRARLANGLADRTPASREWTSELLYTGSTSIDGGAAFSTDSAVTVSTTAPKGVPSVTHVGISNDGVTWTTRTYSPSQAWTLASGNGTRTVRVTWRDAKGNWSAPTSDSIVVDAVKPATTGPRQTFVSGATLVSGKVAVRLTWTGVDAGSGIASYRISRSTDWGAWSSGSAVTNPTFTTALSGGHTYRFRVRAVDRAGNIGSWSYGSSFRLSAFSQNAGVYRGSWSTVASTKYWGGSARTSSAAGSRVTFTFTGRSFAWITTKAPTRGRAAIYVNGKYIGTVDLYASTLQARVVGWTKAWATSRSRTIEIRVLGTGGRPRIDVDGFWATR